MALRTDSPTPGSVADLTVDWFNRLVAPNIGPQRAQAIECEEGSAGRGFTTQVVRIHIQWESQSRDPPRSVIVKLALPELAAQSDTYLESLNVERLWYTAEGTTCPVRVPRCYYACIDELKRTFCLVLEDLWWMRGVDPTQGLTVDRARLALTALAQLHNYDPKLIDLRQAPAKLSATLMRHIEQSWDAFVGFCADAIPEGFYDLPGFLRAVEAAAANIRVAPRTFVHGDYKLDNLLFGQTDADEEIAVLDWQGAGYGWAIEELAGFLPRSLRNDVSAEPLLSAYRLAIAESNEKLVSEDEFLIQYRYGLVLSLAGNIADTQILLGGEWSGGDKDRQDRMLDYAQFVFNRKLRSIAEST